MFKKKSFLNRNSANDLSELIARILITINNQEGCIKGRRIDFIILITEILVYQRDNEKKLLIDTDFEIVCELEYLNNLANNHNIKDIQLHTKLRQYLVHLSNNQNSETKQFEHSDIAKEEHDYLTSEIKKTLPIIKLLNSRDY